MFLRLYKDGVWHGRSDRVINVDGVEHDLDEYAKKHGIDLPDSKKKKTKVNSNEDIRQQDDEGIDSESGDGISEDTE